MSSAPVRPTRPKAIISANPTPGSLFQGSSSMPALSVVSPGPLPANTVVNPLQKFAQLILYGIAMFAIWGGILAIAFAENSTNLNFLILGVGGLISAGMAIALVKTIGRADILATKHIVAKDSKILFKTDTCIEINY